MFCFHFIINLYFWDVITIQMPYIRLRYRKKNIFMCKPLANFRCGLSSLKLDLWLKWVIEIGILNQSLMFKIYSFLLFLIIGHHPLNF